MTIRKRKIWFLSGATYSLVVCPWLIAPVRAFIG